MTRRVGTLLALLGLLGGAGCGAEGEMGPQGPQGEPGAPAPLGSAGEGLAQEGTQLAVRFGDEAGTVAQGNDPRLSDARLPLPGSPHYLQNAQGLSGTERQDASFRISGAASAT